MRQGKRIAQSERFSSRVRQIQQFRSRQSGCWAWHFGVRCARACLKELEHEVIVYCKANPQIRIIEAIDVLLKQERFTSGFK